MLQRVQAEISHARRFTMTVDAEHAALFVQLVIPKIIHSLRLSRIRAAFNRSGTRILCVIFGRDARATLS